MGLTYASLRLTNMFTGASVEVQALVDSGAMPLCIPESVARQLGFDTTEVYSTRIKIADASWVTVPVVAPDQDRLRKPQLHHGCLCARR